MSKFTTYEEFNEDRVQKWYALQRYLDAVESFSDAQFIAIQEGILPETTKLREVSDFSRIPPSYVTMYEEGM